MFAGAFDSGIFSIGNPIQRKEIKYFHLKKCFKGYQWHL